MIVLASTSSTRQSMLRNAGVGFSVEAPQVDERQLVADNPSWSPQDTACELAVAKALDVSKRNADAFVIGADQVLAIGSQILGKPRDQAHCIEQLKMLRGQEHKLISAVVIVHAGQKTWVHVDEAKLTMRMFSDRFLNSYLDAVGADCTTSVGGYRIEDLGIQLFTSIDGDHFTILGMPLLALLNELRRLGEVNS